MMLDVEIVTDSHAVVHAKCVSCRTLVPLEMTPDELKKLIGSQLSIQECLPNMDRHYREMLVSGFCPSCWKRLFKPKVRDAR
jgi:hypothetical protein